MDVDFWAESVAGADERSCDKACQAAISDKVIVGYLFSAAFVGKMIDTVEAIDKNAAIEDAFKANDPRKLIAVQRR
jgi:hypothetical protein